MGVEERGDRESPPLQPLRQMGTPPEADREVQEMAWKRIRGEVVRSEERDREVAERKCSVREEEVAAARKGHRVIADWEGDTPPTDMEERSPYGKRVGGNGVDGRHARGKRRRVEERGASGTAGAPRPTRYSPEPSETDWGSESPLPRHCARHGARREQWLVRGWRAGEVAEWVRYVKWAGRTRGGREWRRTQPFRDLVHKAARP